MLMIAYLFTDRRRGDPLVRFVQCLPPHLLPIAGIDAQLLSPSVQGVEWFVGKLGDPMVQCV